MTVIAGFAPVQLLLVEDNLGDVRPVNLHVATDGAEAMVFLRREDKHADAPRPDLILLNLDLSKMDGLEVVALSKKKNTLKTIPTGVLTTFDAAADIVKSYQLHANCYLTKPAEFVDYADLVKSINEFWLKKARPPQQLTVA